MKTERNRGGRQRGEPSVRGSSINCGVGGKDPCGLNMEEIG